MAKFRQIRLLWKLKQKDKPIYTCLYLPFKMNYLFLWKERPWSSGRLIWAIIKVALIKALLEIQFAFALRCLETRNFFEKCSFTNSNFLHQRKLRGAKDCQFSANFMKPCWNLCEWYIFQKTLWICKFHI